MLKKNIKNRIREKEKLGWKMSTKENEINTVQGGVIDLEFLYHLCIVFHVLLLDCDCMY